MEMESLDYSQSTRKGGVLESASKRVRMIFSVMASPNRIDILRILNTKGPLTYSELKALAGFKSKKESGKFAYHLRKLLRQLLVALNKAERRYTITNLGKLVLSLARQIEERSIIESGKMYVRTSNHTIEEFNSHKIIQSLVREASLPLEQAQKITEEVENKIYKFQTAYLTSSLIRETVNSVLIEHGHEEYRNKLARVGLPVSDIAGMLASEDATRDGAQGVMSRTANAVFSEYFVFNTLPKDIADMHLAGEINIASSGTWGLLPDTIFLDLSELDSIDLQGRFPAAARIASLKSADDMLTALPVMMPLLACEASAEVVLEGVAPVLAKAKDVDDLASKFARALVASSATGPGPAITINVEQDTDAKQTNALLDGYKKYVNVTPLPRIGLALGGMKKESADHVASTIRAGGIVTIGTGRAASGIRKAAGTRNPPAAMTLHSLSINLPRLAHESNRDETYFRAKLALALKPSLAASSMRKNLVLENARRGLLPAFSAATQSLQRATTGVVINLTGTHEAVYSILGHDATHGGSEVMRKVLKTAVDVAQSQAKQLGEEAAIAMVADGSGLRFASIDSDKYGRVSLAQSQNITSYSQGMTLSGKELLSKGSDLVKECAGIDKLLNGGLAASIDVTDLSAGDVRDAIETASELAFWRPRFALAVCAMCGKKSKASSDRCESCKSPHRLA